jgi:hypothetical protein
MIAWIRGVNEEIPLSKHPSFLTSTAEWHLLLRELSIIWQHALESSPALLVPSRWAIIVIWISGLSILLPLRTPHPLSQAHCRVHPITFHFYFSLLVLRHLRMDFKRKKGFYNG